MVAVCAVRFIHFSVGIFYSNHAFARLEALAESTYTSICEQRYNRFWKITDATFLFDLNMNTELMLNL